MNGETYSGPRAEDARQRKEAHSPAGRFHIQWHITNRCPVRCPHCYQEDFTPAADLPRPRLDRVLDSVLSFLREEDLRLTVNLTGGEPLLSPDWRHLLGRLRADDRVEELGIITSGLFFSPDDVAFLQTVPGAGVKLSLEGFSRAAYERFRGRGAWPHFLAGLAAARGAGLPVTVMFTLLESNLGEVSGLFPFMEEHGVERCIVERFIPWGRGRDLGCAPVSREDWFSACRTLLARTGGDDDLRPLTPFRAFMVTREGGRFGLLGAPCVVARDGIAVMPDATVFPCRRFPLAVGNLLSSRLGDIWRDSPVLNALRDRAALKGRCGECPEADCRGCRAFVYATTGDWLAEDDCCFCAAGECDIE